MGEMIDFIQYVRKRSPTMNQVENTVKVGSQSKSNQERRPPPNEGNLAKGRCLET